MPRWFVVHSTRSGAPHDDGYERIGTLGWFQSPTSLVSAHFVGDASGGLTPVVPLEFSAWHAGAEHNPYSVGIELTQPTSDRPFCEGHYQAAALAFRLVNKWLASRGQPPIPPTITTRQQEPGIIGHSDTPQGRSAGKSDPGPRFDWERFLALLS